MDHHVHFLATAAALLSVDVTGAPRLADVVTLLEKASAGGRGAGWVRAWGYDEALLEEGRHPTRDDLDIACPGRPLVVHHRTGHVAVLNSLALREVGEVDHPDGVLSDRHDILSRVPRIDPDILAGAARSVSREWAVAGVGAFVDATHTNGPEELELLARWCHEEVVQQDVTAMISAESAPSLAGYGSHVGAVRVGHVKVMPATVGPALRLAVQAAHTEGYPVAVHVTEVDVLEEAIEALEGSAAPAGTADRIEHNALSLPEQVGRLAATGARVVVNPSFLLHRRDKYRAQLSTVEQGWLVRIRSLVDAGISVRAGSDSPVTPACPAEIVAAATAHPFAPEESVDAETAAGLLWPWDTD